MTNYLSRLDQPVSVANLSSYIHWVNTIPMLTLEEEQDLATRLQENNDLEAARRMVMSHLRLVVRMARGYSGYGLPQEDLIQEGNIGLMKAVKRFNPAVGVRLVSFAIHWIRAEMHEYILKNWRIVKIATTKAQRKLFFNLRKASKKLGWLSQAEITTVASELNVSEADVRQMEARLSSYDQSLDTKEEDNEDSGHRVSAVPAHVLEDQSADPEMQVSNRQWASRQEAALHQALKTLDDRSKSIIEQRWLTDNKATLHELAAEYQVSAERVRQLEKSAMKKLQLAIAEAA